MRRSAPIPTPYLLKFPRLVQNLKVISDAAAGHGMFTVEPDPDGIFRRMPLVMMAEGKMRLGLSAEVLRIATGGQAFATRTDDAGISGIVVGGVFVPTDGSGKVHPWFNASDRSRYVSAGSILDGSAPAREHCRPHGADRNLGRRARGLSRDARGGLHAWSRDTRANR